MTTPTYTPIATTTVSGSSTKQVTFSSIPTTYSQLILIFQAGIAQSQQESFRIRINNKSDSNYYCRASAAASNSKVSEAFTTANEFTYGNLNLLFGNLGNVTKVVFFDANGTDSKSILMHTGVGGAYATHGLGNYPLNSAITEIDIFVDFYDLRDGSVFSLYGIEA